MVFGLPLGRILDLSVVLDTHLMYWILAPLKMLEGRETTIETRELISMLDKYKRQE